MPRNSVLANTELIRFIARPVWWGSFRWIIMTGTWRSLVARFAGGEEVAGSNPVVPTILKYLKLSIFVALAVCKMIALFD